MAAIEVASLQSPVAGGCQTFGPETGDLRLETYRRRVAPLRIAARASPLLA
jgi:hypothetical protein